MWRPRDRAALGRKGERAAVRYLRRAGFRILARNVRIGRYEIDIIARDGEVTVLVEVRTRGAADAVRPEETVGPVKQRHLRTATRMYMAREADPERNYRIDMVSVVAQERGKPEITHYRDAVRD